MLWTVLVSDSRRWSNRVLVLETWWKPEHKLGVPRHPSHQFFQGAVASLIGSAFPPWPCKKSSKYELPILYHIELLQYDIDILLYFKSFHYIQEYLSPWDLYDDNLKRNPRARGAGGGLRHSWVGARPKGVASCSAWRHVCSMFMMVMLVMMVMMVMMVKSTVEHLLDDATIKNQAASVQVRSLLDAQLTCYGCWENSMFETQLLRIYEPYSYSTTRWVFQYWKRRGSGLAWLYCILHFETIQNGGTNSAILLSLMSHDFKYSRFWWIQLRGPPVFTAYALPSMEYYVLFVWHLPKDIPTWFKIKAARRLNLPNKMKLKMLHHLFFSLSLHLDWFIQTLKSFTVSIHILHILQLWVLSMSHFWCSTGGTSTLRLLTFEGQLASDPTHPRPLDGQRGRVLRWARTPTTELLRSYGEVVLVNTSKSDQNLLFWWLNLVF